MGNACVGRANPRIPTPPTTPSHAGGASQPATSPPSYSSSPADRGFSDLPQRQASSDSGSPSPRARSSPPQAHAGHMPHTLRWPNGERSAGMAAKSGPAHARFTADPSDPMITSRKAASDAQGVSCLSARIDRSVSRSERQFVPILPRLRDMHLGAASDASAEDVMAILSNVSYRKRLPSDSGEGLDARQQAVVLDLYAGALQALAQAQSGAPAIAAAAQALANPIRVEISVGFDPHSGGLTIAGSAAKSLQAVRHAVRNLEEGQHLFLPINYSSLQGTHAVGLSITSLPGATQPTLRVSLTDTEYPEPGIYVDVSRASLLRALPGLLDGTLGFEGQFPYQDYMEVAFREPLRDWLEQIDPSQHVSSTYFGDKLLEQPVQNGASCVTENPLAFLATVLEPGSYKLAKAACLDAVRQLAEARIDDPTDSSIDRLQDRITHALAGSTVA